MQDLNKLELAKWMHRFHDGLLLTIYNSLFQRSFFLRMEVFPPCLHALFIAERRAQSQHMNHSRRSIVRRWHASTIQQHDTVRNCTNAVAIFGPPQAVAALARELSARFLAQGNNRRGDRTPASWLWGQLFTDRGNRPPRGHRIYIIPEVIAFT